MWFGQSLRNERERQGVSLEAVAEGTKVSVKNLRALEDGNDAALPSGVFHRGIVQSYCRFLELDETEWLARFRESQQGRDPDWTEFAQAVSRNRPDMARNVGPRWWAVAGMLLLLAAVGWAAWHFVVKPRVGHPAQIAPATAMLRIPAANPVP